MIDENDDEDDDLELLPTISSSASFRSDKFDIETKDLGKLTAINIRHDNSWFGSAWYLEKVRRFSFIIYLNSIYLSYLQKCIFFRIIMQYIPGAHHLEGFNCYQQLSQQIQTFTTRFHLRQNISLFFATGISLFPLMSQKTSKRPSRSVHFR